MCLKTYIKDSEALNCVLTLHFCLGAFSYAVVIFSYPATEFRPQLIRISYSIYAYYIIQPLIPGDAIWEK
jgi:hypothetical protein